MTAAVAVAAPISFYGVIVTDASPSRREFCGASYRTVKANTGMDNGGRVITDAGTVMHE